MIHLKTKDIKKLRDKILKNNKNICPVLKKEIPNDRAVLDHIHKQKITDDITEKSGVVRNVIDRGVNSFLGKIENNFVRYIPKNTITLSDLLRNLADYIEAEPYKENNEYFSHPRENGNGDLIKMKKIPFLKTKYNKLNEAMKQNKKKTPKYTKFLNEKFLNLLKEYNI